MIPFTCLLYLDGILDRTESQPHETRKLMKLRLVAGLMLIILHGKVMGVTQEGKENRIAAVTAANTDPRLTVIGRIFKECTVNMPEGGNFDLGSYSINEWVTGQSWLSSGPTPSFVFTLTDCGEQVKVYISATGTSVNQTDKANWLANQTGTSDELAASINLIKRDGNAMLLKLNDSPYLYTTTTGNTPIEVTLQGLLNRTDNSRKPTGTFAATLTINFEFA